jgi:hypothetical protein
MESSTDICREILYDFLDKWPVDKVKRMTLRNTASFASEEGFFIPVR